MTGQNTSKDKGNQLQSFKEQSLINVTKKGGMDDESTFMGEKINDDARRNTFTENKNSEIDRMTEEDQKIVIKDSLFVDNVGIGGNLGIDDNPNITVAIKDDTVVHGMRLDEYPADYYSDTMIKTVIWNLFFCNLLV